MDQTLIERLATPVPRYTSYPTAPHFHDGVGSETYEDWLARIDADAALSLYAHVPYCDRLCWFCACHTRQSLRYEPVKAYVEGLCREIELVGGHLAGRGRVTALHLGGGSPTMLRPDDMIALRREIDRRFTWAERPEISVEMDPNDLDGARHDALAAIGLTRASLGIQDFDPVVQKAINRLQTFEQTRAVVEACRARAVRSVNCDVLYGLPHQTTESLEATMTAVLSLRPDRIALFGYAHVPWMKKHQTMIDPAALPSVTARFEQMRHAAGMLLAAGYTAIGIDHFALPGDGLAAAARGNRLNRNFQGYTEDTAECLIGLGASAIGRVPQGYTQNMPATGEYLRRVRAGVLPTVRGYALTDEDRARAWIISRIMCDFGFSLRELCTRFPDHAATLLKETHQVAARDRDGLVAVGNGRFRLRAAGRPFARAIAAAFDGFLSGGGGRHSLAV
ncbi:oxygen-independent coproporphyrinogen III oxidase [Rhizobium sp. TRM95111]|uniref:oxygen-independent coproporphyrinogen III oxidase n=1 Tax=Rhizobium alarense TaxID=2846851 RepID=UPI001F3D7216|nr:oxygen-independent coproporphyrinogen III oxidase [Rhizobium alarense]MCF3640868.1 oxygen-independent coproporphyrinogen III oxidase [Rhizobium alarense]